ncbi:MAG: glycoside hydrolase family 3 C-terminal domain-containing protein [Kordia sp.]|uniref:glycoside hydrolase family 3 protein n=1 Tax=Kordia sp. TaxID=1965332 RepID=UPI00385A297B
MKNFTRLFFTVSILVLIQSCNTEDILIYKNPDVNIDARVDDLLGRMTIEEKFWQLFMIPGDISEGKEKYKHGIFGFQVATKSSSSNSAEQILDYSGGGKAKETAVLINEMQKYFIEETRLGIPIIPFDEALHGLIREDATVFPQAIGLAASFNTKLMDTVAAAIATEVRSRGIRQNLSPVINIARDVRWGRVEETYGEDPFLTSKMAVSYIKAFEERGVITTPKHFVANVGDGGRDSYPIHFNDRILEEIYYPAFKASIQEGNARSIMTAYNSVDGTQATASNELLNQKLKKDWGFKGFVISDAGAVGGANVLHFTAKDYAESTKQAIEGGLDVIFQTSYNHYPLFYEAFEKGMIDENAIEEAVRRVLYAKFKLGLFDNPYVNIDDLENQNSVVKNKSLAKTAALESIVLLKNDTETLPFKKTINSIAVIGPDANESRLGGYSGPGNNPVSILKGIQNKVGNKVKVNYSRGTERIIEDFVAVPEANLFHMVNGEKQLGLKGEYFNNITLKGEPALSRIDKNIDFRWTLFSPDQSKINYDYYAARWTGKLLAPETGTIDLGIKGDDGYRVYINDELIIDNWKKQTVQQITTPYKFVKGKVYDLKVEFYETTGNVWFKLIWNAGIENNWKNRIAEAVTIAKSSDIAIVCVGIEEGEFRDRAFLSLPGYQEELINAVTETGTPTVVVLVGGSAITMKNWLKKVPAVLHVWYPGDEGGNAVADVLFGDYNPAGRLPITFPIDVAQVPLYYNHKPTGRGDDYINLSGKPLFPFGYGLSYTTFEYSNLQLEKSTIHSLESVSLTCTITNTGNFDGDEVVQLYIKDEYASIVRPISELKGFQRVHLKKGESKTLTFEITPKMLALVDKELKRTVEQGNYRITIGSSSNDIRLRKTVKVE